MSEFLALQLISMLKIKHLKFYAMRGLEKDRKSPPKIIH